MKIILIILKKTLLFLLLIFLATRVYAHPHLFITKKIVFVFDDNGLSGIRINWMFDEFSTTMLASDFDKNKNGKLEKKEEIEVKKNYFDYLKNYHYFTDIEINEKPFLVEYIKNFKATLNKNRLIYSFLIPCHITIIKTEKKITFSQFDSTYYSALFFAEKNPISFENKKKIKVSYEIKTNKEKTFYYGTMNPTEIIIKLKK